MATLKQEDGRKMPNKYRVGIQVIRTTQVMQ
jgi:hypothetical protein